MSPPTSEAPELGGGGGFRAETAVTGSRSEPADCAADSPAGPTASELTAALRAAGFSVGVAGAGFVVARWHYVRELPDAAALRAFAERAGVLP